MEQTPRNSTRSKTSVDAQIPDNAPHLLIVDDDQRIRELLAKYLMNNGYRITTACDAASARAALGGLTFDLLILDVMMPGETGYELAESLRGKITAPILMLTALADPANRVQGLELGVADYMAKPFEPKELLLRIHNILTPLHRTIEQKQEIRFGDLTFQAARGELTRNGDPVKLTERERELLRIFTSRPGETVPRMELVPDDVEASDRAVDVQINRLRRKIEKDPANPVYLQTVRGKGYILHID